MATLHLAMIDLVMVVRILLSAIRSAPIEAMKVASALVIAVVGNTIVARVNAVNASIAPHEWIRLRTGSAEIRKYLLRLNLALAQSRQIVRYCFFLVQADLAGISTDEALIKYTPGKLVELLFFQRAQHARADFCGIGDRLQRNPSLLALFAKFVPKRSQGSLRRRSKPSSASRWE
jgi:hypothetical protein